MPKLRLLGVAALCVAFAPFAPAQQAAAPPVDCSQVAPSEGPADPAYAACARPPADAPAPRGTSNAPSFGHDFQNSAFVSFEEGLPQVYGLVTPYAPTDFINAGDFRGNDLETWFGLDADGRAISLNANTGVLTELGRINPPAGQTWTALTWDYQEQVFYGLTAACGSETSLFTVDFDAGTKTRVGAGNQGLLCGIALASDPADGTLYAYGISRNELATINKSTGSVTPIGALGFDPNFGQEMDFNNIDGTLLAFAYNNDTMRGELRSVNTNTGSTTFLGRLGGAFPGGSNQIGAGSSRTPRAAVSVTASLNLQSVPQGGTLSSSYQVCNGTGDALAGDLSYQVFRNGSAVTPEVAVASGSISGRTCSSEMSFDLSVPSDTPIGVYVIDVTADPDGAPAMTVSLPIAVAPARAAGSITEWTVSNATPWPAPETDGTVSAAATATTEIGAYPNPFARQTTLTFSLDDAADVRLAVYDVLGREVAVLTDGLMEAGEHTATLDARDLAAGTYVYRLVAGDTVQSGQLTLVK